MGTLISLIKKHALKYFRDLFEIKHRELSIFCIFPLPYIVISEFGFSSSVVREKVELIYLQQKSAFQQQPTVKFCRTFGGTCMKRTEQSPFGRVFFLQYFAQG